MKILVDEYVIMLATRYALGRKTYVVSEITEELKKHWPDLSDKLKRQIHSDIETAFDRNDVGMEMDKKAWKEILELKIAE